MKAKHLLLIAGLYSLSTFGQIPGGAVPNKDYVTYPMPINSGIREMIDNVPSALDIANNAVYISGFTRNSFTLRDYLLIKYDRNTGAVIWQRTFDYAGLNDRALAITVDNSGNVIITGEATSASNGTDIITRKYDTNGNLLWSVIHNGSANGDDKGLGIVTDNSGDVYICGYSSNTGTGKDFTVIRYNSSGVQQYVYTKNGTSNGDDIANAIAFFGNKLYVAGNITNTGSGADIYITRLNSNNAFVNWSNTKNGTASTNDQGLDIKVMGNDVLVCGGVNNTGTGQDYFFGKYNASNGISVFTKSYDAFGTNDFATSLVYDASNTYAITGLAQNGTNYEYHTTKYNNTGTLSWVNKHKTNSAFLNVFPKIAVDALANHFYVSGVTFNSSIDGALYQITPGGNQSWVDYHDGFGLRDGHVDLSVDNLGRIYLASLNERSSNVFDIALIRYSQTPVYFPIDFNNINEPFSMAHLFYPNSGEIKDGGGNSVGDVLYYTNFTHPAEYVLKNRIAFFERKLDSVDAIVRNDSLSRIDMVFNGANEFSKIFPFNFQTDAVLNYFIADTIGITNVQGANHLICPNIYPMIDLHYSSNEKGSKYFFVVKPTGDPNNIQLSFDGAASTGIIGSTLKISSDLSSFIFKKPDIYNVTPGLTTLSVTSVGWVSMGSDTYSINPGAYNSMLPLIIEFDMGKTTATVAATDNMSWSTDFGGTGPDLGYSVKADASGNVYIGGYSESHTAFPTTAGAFQTALNTSDIRSGVIVKFRNNRSMAWATYYGGTDIDEIKSMTYDNPNARLYVCGSTFSGDFPITNKSGASVSQPASGVLKTAFVADINPTNGFPRWSYCTKLINWNQVWEDICIDNSGNKYLVGYTASGPGTNTLTLVNTIGFYSQTTYGGGTAEAIIARFNSADVLQWLTYFGGNGDDIGTSIEIDQNNGFYISGRTNSNVFNTYDPSITGALYNTTNNGNYDLFFARFNSSGARQWATLFGGSAEEYSTQADGIVTVGNNVFFYLTTSSTGLNTMPYTTQAIQSYGGGLTDTYILGLDANYNQIWATYHGGSDAEQAMAITKSGDGSIFVTGSTFSSNFPTVSPYSFYTQSYQSSAQQGMGFIAGGDAFISAFKTGNLKLSWSTFIGGGSLSWGGGDDYAYGIDIYSNKCFITGGTASDTPLYPWYNPGTSAYMGGSTLSGDIIISEFDISTFPLASVDENFQINKSHKVYPNPFANSIFITNLKDETIQIYDVKGSLIKSDKVSGNYSVDLSGYSNGIYLIKIEDKNGVYETHKLIKAQ